MGRGGGKVFVDICLDLIAFHCHYNHRILLSSMFLNIYDLTYTSACGAGSGGGGGGGGGGIECLPMSRQKSVNSRSSIAFVKFLILSSIA